MDTTKDNIRFDEFEKFWLKIPVEERTKLFSEWMNADECVWELIRRYENKKG